LNNKGSILVVVLIFTAILAAGAVSLLGKVALNLDRSEQLLEFNQAGFYIHSAIASIESIINNDNNGYDSDEDIWANLPPISIKDGLISIQVMPANAKININNISSSDAATAKRVADAVEKLTNENDIEDALKHIKGWIDKKQSYDENYYQNRIPPYKPAKKPFYSLKEIDYVNGLSKFSEKFGSDFSVDGSKAININFANKDVIEAYLPEIADEADSIIKYRKKKPFKNITQLRNVSGISDKQYLEVQPYISTSSSFFIVKIVVIIKKKEYNATALIEREPQTKVVKYFEGKSNYE